MLLAVLLLAAPADVPWISKWMDTGSAKPEFMKEWHDEFAASPHARGALDFEAMQRTRRVAEGSQAKQLASTALAMLKSSKAAPDVHYRAARVLGWLQWDEAIPALRTAALAGEPAAIDALGYFGEHEKRSGAILFGGRPATFTFPSHANAAALDALLEAMKSDDAETKQIAISQLQFFDGPKLADAWHSVAASCSSMAAMVWIAANDEAGRLEILERCATAKDNETRAVALMKLGEIGGRSQIPRLLAALDDTDPMIFLAAHRALSQLEGHLGYAPESAIDDREMLTALWRKKFADVH